jgi:succinyl-diaminopimelate desuccinylase
MKNFIKKLSLLALVCSSASCMALDEDSTQEKLTGYLSTLVSMNTTTADKNSSEKALKWVGQELKDLPLHFKSYEFDGYHSLVITTRQTKKPKVFLVAHMDVVPGKEELFHPVIKNNKLYGRGAYDMKMAIACYILLMHELKDQMKELDIGIMLTTDEEIGGMNGVKRLMEEGYSSSIALLPDGGFDWKFEEAAKGVLQIKVSAKGKSAHGSRPWAGENAINKLMFALMEINDYFDKEKAIYADYYPTVNVGVFQGGSSTNQVPDYAEAKLDIRYPPSMTADQIFSTMKDITKKYPNVSLEKLLAALPRQEDLHRAPFNQFKELAKKLYGIEVGSVLAHGASDARFFGEKQIPVIVIAPKGGEIHSDGEWIDLEDLVRFYEVMKAWILATPVNN